MASSLNASTSGGGGVIVTSDASGNLDIQSGGSTVVAVTSAGASVTGTLAATGASTFTGTGKFATTIGVGNATPAASGSGITFPATQSASSDANTLDDYEEGSCTLGVSFGGGTTAITYAVAAGFYTRIGNLVTVTGTFELTNKGSSTGNAKITGLPFAVVNNNGASSTASITLQDITFLNQWAAIIDINATTISLFEFTAAGARTSLTNSDFLNYSSVIISATYRA